MVLDIALLSIQGFCHAYPAGWPGHLHRWCSGGANQEWYRLDLSILASGSIAGGHVRYQHTEPECRLTSSSWPAIP
jgi:hypothetical protein